MGITGLIPFMEKASRRANIAEFSGCSVAIDTYCWLHKGAFACADKLVRGEQTDIHIKYCMKYVNMLLSNNIKPILVFDGRHLPAKAQTEAKRRESRETAKKRAAELLRLGQTNEARTMMRRGVDITHEMALQLIKQCRAIGVDCIVAPYEADAQLAFLNIKNIAHIVITEDSDLVLFGCSKIMFKMDLEGNGMLVDCSKLALTMKCPIEKYSLDKFRRVCIMSGCDYVSSLPGIGLAKAAQFVAPIQETNFANALKKLPSFFNKNIKVTPEYIDSFLKAEATFKHQFVYDPIERAMVRLTDPEEEGTDMELCCNAGELLDEQIAFQLALGNLDPFTLRQMDDWHPDTCDKQIKTASWSESQTAKHPSIWQPEFSQYLNCDKPWQKKHIFRAIRNGFSMETRAREKVVNVVVPETQDIGLSIETLSNMYCSEPSTKRHRPEENAPNPNNKRTILTENDIIEELNNERTSPILKNKSRSFKKAEFQRFSKFKKTVLSDNIIESKFFSNNDDLVSSEGMTESQKENSTDNCSRNPFKVNCTIDVESCGSSERQNDSIVDNTYPMEELLTPTCSQTSFGKTPSKSDKTNESDSATGTQILSNDWRSKSSGGAGSQQCGVRGRGGIKGLGLTRRPTNQPTLLEKFGFKKRTSVKL